MTDALASTCHLVTGSLSKFKYKESRLGSRSYRVRGYKQGRGLEAIPTGLVFKVA